MIRGLEKQQRPALLISECQRGILDPALTMLGGLAEQVAERGILPRIARLADAFRERELPVFHIHIAHLPGYAGAAVTSPLAGRSRRENKMIVGTPDVEAMPDVAPREGDFVCARRSGLAMWYGTDLDAMLRNCGVETLVLTGVSTNLALFGGSLGAVDRGFSTVIVEDAAAGGSPESHAWMLQNTYPLLASITGTDELLAALAKV